MKDFSHVDGGDLQYADLEAGLNSTLNVVWNEIKYKAEVTKEYGSIPQIECYPSQLNQVFMNLLVNAAHAIEKHGGRFEVHSEVGVGTRFRVVLPRFRPVPEASVVI
jgi:signal transduction histidine kinase